MTVTLDSRFSSITISGSWYNFNGWDYVSATLDDATDTDPATTIDFAVTELGVVSAGDPAPFAVMGEILERDGEFRDADGNAVAVQVNNIDPITTYQQLLDAGYPSPFDNYPTTWYQRGIIGLDAGALTTRSVNANGQVAHVEEMSKIPGLQSPNGESMTVSMTEWTTREYLSEWQIVYDYTEADGVTLENRHDRTEWTVLLTMLDGLRTSGEAVPDDLDTDAAGYQSDNPLPGRVFTFTPEGGSAQTFTVNRFSWTLTDGGWLTELICHCTPGSGSSYVQADYAAFIQTRDVTIGSVANSLVPTWGSYSVPLRAKSLDLPNGQSIVVRGEGMAKRRRDGLEVPMDGEVGMTVDTSALDPYVGSAADWWMAEPTITGVHHTATDGGDKTIRLRSPVDALRAGVTARQSIHNRQPNQHGPKVNVTDWDGNLLFTLRPTQRAEIQLTHGTDGVGEVVVTQIPTREHYRGGAQIANLGANRIEWSTTHWAIPIPTGGSGVTDADAFTLGATAYAEGVGWASVQHERLPGSIVPTWGGQIAIDLEVELASPITGLIDAGWETELRGSRAGNTYAVSGTTRYQQSYGGIGQRRLLHVGWRGIVKAGDIYTPIIRWAKSSTMVMSGVQIVAYQLSVELNPQIEADTN